MSGPPLWSIQSRVLSKGKNSKKILTSKLAWPKKLAPEPPLQIQSPELLVKEKILKNVWPQIWSNQISRWIDPPPKNSESRVLCKWKNSENFLTSNLAGPKKFGFWTPFQKIQSRALRKGKNSEKFLISNLTWPKEVGVWTLPQQIQRPEHLVKEKILKNFWPQIWHEQKKLVLRPPDKFSF